MSQVCFHITVQLVIRSASQVHLGLQGQGQVPEVRDRRREGKNGGRGGERIGDWAAGGRGGGGWCLKSQEYSPCCMSFHKTQYLELSSKVTRQLCLELLTWGREREGQCETVAGEKPLEHGLPLPFLFPQVRGFRPLLVLQKGEPG